jgi:hypothetical protein
MFQLLTTNNKILICALRNHFHSNQAYIDESQLIGVTRIAIITASITRSTCNNHYNYIHTNLKDISEFEFHNILLRVFSHRSTYTV